MSFLFRDTRLARPLAIEIEETRPARPVAV